MDEKIFSSELGDVKVSIDEIERPERKGDWSRIESEFSKKELIDQIDFRELEEIDFDPGSYFSVIKLKISGEWKRMFFRFEDEGDDCFDFLKYRFSSYQQNH